MSSYGRISLNLVGLSATVLEAAVPALKRDPAACSS